MYADIILIQYVENLQITFPPSQYCTSQYVMDNTF